MMHFKDHKDLVLIMTLIELAMQRLDDAATVGDVTSFIQRVAERLPVKGGYLTKREKHEAFRLVMALLPKRKEASQ